MANEIRLEVYTIQIRAKGKKLEYKRFNDFFDQTDFLEFFGTFIESFKSNIKVDDEQKKSMTIRADKVKLDSGKRLISGIIESGDYGYESPIYDRNNGNHKYTRQVDDTEIKPFYFLIFLPADYSKGFVMLQRFGVYGIHSIFKAHLTSFFKSAYQELLLEFNPFLSSKLAKHFIDNGSIREFSLIRHNLPADLADKLGFTDFIEDVLSIEIVIKAKNKHKLPINKRVKKFVNNPNSSFFEVRELQSLGFNGEHKTKIKVSHSGNTRTIDLQDTGQIRPYYDINDVVKILPSGHPEFESIDSISKSLMSDLYKEINIGN